MMTPIRRHSQDFPGSERQCVVTCLAHEPNFNLFDAPGPASPGVESQKTLGGPWVSV